MMRLTIISMAVLMALVPSVLTAQQAGENINVLPVVPPEDLYGDPIADAVAPAPYTTVQRILDDLEEDPLPRIC